MSVIVTGAAGIVGYNAVIQCAQAGINVVAYDRLKCNSKPMITEKTQL